MPGRFRGVRIYRSWGVIFSLKIAALLAWELTLLFFVFLVSLKIAVLPAWELNCAIYRVFHDLASLRKHVFYLHDSSILENIMNFQTFQDFLKSQAFALLSFTVCWPPCFPFLC